MHAELGSIVGPDHVIADPPARYLQDATVSRGLRGRADAVVLPGSAEETAAVLAWCYERGVPVTPRGGGTGFAGGAVPVEGGVLLSLERLARVRSLDPGVWRMEVEAGVTTAHVRRLARENGLLFPPDPGAAEDSQIGGNIATNAGGPHAFKYGVTGAWVTGLEAAMAPGELVRMGGPVRKDVAGYDLRGLLVGSEGTLGVITAAWLALLPAPEAALPLMGLYAGPAEGCEAIGRVLASGLVPAALEYLDAGTLRAAAAGFPGGLDARAGFMVLAEADGSRAEAERLAEELREALAGGALAVLAPDPGALWRWRDGVSIAVGALRGGKVSEDVAVPVDRLREAIEGTLEIGRRHGLEACSWGHAGDGNLHSTFLLPREEAARAEAAAAELFELALALGGSISGEHGVGLVKRGQVRGPVRLHAAVKAALDPKGLLNPQKKLPG
ncbi:MAG: FAD-linked oxidase C-terminal domain-containing protein [Thermoleophilaceae bacterium]